MQTGGISTTTCPLKKKSSSGSPPRCTSLLKALILMGIAPLLILFFKNLFQSGERGSLGITYLEGGLTHLSFSSKCGRLWSSAKHGAPYNCCRLPYGACPPPDSLSRVYHLSHPFSVSEILSYLTCGLLSALSGRLFCCPDLRLGGFDHISVSPGLCTQKIEEGLINRFRCKSFRMMLQPV